MKNNLIILLDAQGNLITEPIGQLRANAEFNADITVIAPFDLTSVVSATFTKDNRVEQDITQYLAPNGSIKGKDRLDKDHPEYQRVYNYNVYEGSIDDVALAYVAKFRAGLLFMSIGFGDIVQPPLATNYKGKFGQGVYLPEQAENGDFYICDEYNFHDQDITFTLDDYAYFYNGKWHKSNYRSLGGTDTFEVSVSPNLKSNVEVTIDQDLGLLLAGRVAILERAVSDLKGNYIDLEARVVINEHDITNIKDKNIDQDNRLNTVESDIEDIEEVDRNQNNTLQDHETRITKNIQDIAAINEGLVKIDNETITRNDNQELEVSSLVLNDINSRVKETDFNNYQNTVQNFLNGKLDKKPDGVIDLINAFNKIDARYLEIDNELFIVVLELPEIGKGNKIYLVPKTGVDNNNKYDEYIYINNKWEALGTITIDLSNYYDIQEVDTLLAAKANNTYLAQVYGGKNLAVPDLTGKEYLGNGWYMFYNERNIEVKFNVYSGIFNVNGQVTQNTEIRFMNRDLIGQTVTATNYVIERNNSNVSISLTTIGTEASRRLYLLNEINTLTTVVNVNFFTFYFNTVDIFDNFQFKLQIEQGTTATPYTLPMYVTPEYIRQTQTPRLIYSNSGTSGGNDITFAYVDNTMKVGDVYKVHSQLTYDNAELTQREVNDLIISDTVNNNIEKNHYAKTQHSAITKVNYDYTTKTITMIGDFNTGDSSNSLDIRLYKVGY